MTATAIGAQVTAVGDNTQVIAVGTIKGGAGGEFASAATAQFSQIVLGNGGGGDGGMGLGHFVRKERTLL